MAVKKRALSASRLREVLNYDPETGIFVWIVNKGTRAKAGNVAGSPTSKGYIEIQIDGKEYLAHRLAFLWMKGAFPIQQVDHENGIHDDNCWLNIRKASNGENQQNIKIRCDNKSGFLGVSRNKDTGRWVAQITANGEKIYLGLFDTPEAAHAAYLAAKAKLHKFQPVPRAERIAA